MFNISHFNSLCICIEQTKLL